MNIANFQILLQEAIQNSTNTTDYLLLAKALESLKVGQIRSVTTFANLPSAASNEGLLVYVEADERLYFSSGAKWDTLYERTVTAYSWGYNNAGQVGDNTVLSRSSPVSVVGGFTDWSSIRSGENHRLGIRSNGTIWAWGCNSYGRIGDNTVINRSSPVSVVGGFTDWVDIGPGGYSSAGVRSNGTLWTWGANCEGSLGNNLSSINVSSPVSVVGGFTDWCAVRMGRVHGIAQRTNGTLWAWGWQNFAPSLGTGDSNDRSSPVSVAGGFTDWISFDTRLFHTVGVRSNGTLWTWGYNGKGQLGDNSITNRNSPISVVGGFTDWCQAAAGHVHTLGIRTNGTLWAWGCNSYGRIGDNTVINRSSPVSVVGGFTNWCSVAAGGNGSAGIRTNGTLWAWGYNNTGHLGDNTVLWRSSPVSVVGGFSNWKCVSSTSSSTTGLTSN